MAYASKTRITTFNFQTMSTLGDFSTVCDAQNMEYLDYKPSDGKVAFSCGGVDFYIYNYVSKTIVGN